MSYRLGKNILATVTYYDVLEMPLTSFEIWKHLVTQNFEQLVCDRPCTLGSVIKFLASEERNKKIVEKNGFYFLSGRENLIEKRIQSEKISVLKLRRMRRLARLLSFLPYIRMLGATGSLAMKNGARESDWDTFVVLRSGKIWIGRTILTGFLHVIRKRRHGEKIQDRVCLNYFVTDDNLEIGTKDLFSAHEYRFLVPLFGSDIFRKFELKNRWILEHRPNFMLTSILHLWIVKENVWQKNIQRKLEAFFDMFHIEKWLATWQKEKIRRNPKTAKEGSLIEAHDHALIFLPNPRGPQVFEKYKERLSM